MPRDFSSLTAVAVFIVTNAAALCAAAKLLGGAAAEKRARHLVEEVAMATPLAGRLVRELDHLEDLLALRHVGDPDREESGYFAMIDPASPAVEEICLLLDGLQAARRVPSRLAA